MRTKFLLFLMLILVSCNKSDDSNISETVDPPIEIGEAFFGKSFPGRVAQAFAHDIFTDELHAPPVFNQSGDEVYWSLMSSTQRNIMCMKLENGIWTEAHPAEFSFSQGSDSPFISSDGNTLLFLSFYGETTKENIWICRKESETWSEPQKLPNAINSLNPHWQSSMSDNGNIYFGATEDHQQYDIYFSKFENGVYAPAETLGNTINVLGVLQNSPFIAPDESYLIFSRVDPNDLDSDMYISIKQNDGSWGQAVPIVEMNSNGHDLYAYVSPDQRYIMFLRSYNGELFPFWISASILDNYIN